MVKRPYEVEITRGGVLGAVRLVAATADEAVFAAIRATCLPRAGIWEEGIREIKISRPLSEKREGHKEVEFFYDLLDESQRFPRETRGPFESFAAAAQAAAKENCPTGQILCKLV